MTTLPLARFLGWFSLALGAAEIAAPAFLSRQLGLRGGRLLVRGFGLREVAAGMAVLGKPDHPFGASTRVVGDVLDIAVLVQATGRANPRRTSATIALAMVLGVTALDVLCAAALAADGNRRRQTARRTRVAISERPVAA